MKICTRCVLPETFPGIHFNEEGVCNVCLAFKGFEHLKAKKAEYKSKFETLLAQYKGKNAYDAIMCYSGGKDSTYTLEILKKEYGLSILALTFDNGFIPQQTFSNINNVVEALGVDHLYFKPNFQLLQKVFASCVDKNIYPLKTLERASSICTSCMGMVKFYTLRLALEKQIPFIGFGWSPGQAPIESSIFKNNPEMIKSMQRVIFDPLYALAGDEIKKYFLENTHFNHSFSFPYNISPLAFLEYDEEEIYRKITLFGWKSPQHTDANSTNCLLNSFANIVHKRQFNFHPYAFELAKLVREGYLTRGIAMQKLDRKENANVVSRVKQRLTSKKKGPELK